MYPILFHVFVVVAGNISNYHGALRKHAAFFKGFESLDFIECMDGLRSEDFVTDDDVDEVERALATGGSKAAWKILYSKLKKLRNDSLRYFVEDILPGLEQTEILITTFQSCTGPGNCSLRPAQPHSLQGTAVDVGPSLQVSLLSTT